MKNFATGKLEQEPAPYKLRVIGEREPLFFRDLRVALDCQSRYQANGKIAFLTRWDETAGDYTLAL